MLTTTALWALFSAALVGLSYFAILALVIGLAWRLLGYLRTPMPLPTAVTPAPTSDAGAAVRVAGDVLIFQIGRAHV